MNVTNIITELLAILTAFVGFYAAKLWLRSSKITIVPTWARYGGIEPAGGESQSNSNWIAGILEASNEVSDLNRRAARWTAVSVGLGAITTIIGAVLPHLPT
jgi:hypothetical protein